MNRYADQATLAFEDWERERKSKQYRYWTMLRNAKNEFLDLTGQESAEYDILDGAFYYYLERNYGLRVELIDCQIAGEYSIVDEKKYLLFLLKFDQ
jgi:hypothetical protein